MSLTWKELAQKGCQAAEDRGEWAGAPMPIDTYPLVVAPSYEFQGLNGVCWNKAEEDEEPKKTNLDVVSDILQETIEPVNSWWCSDRGGNVCIFRVGARTVFYIDRDYARRSSRTLQRSFAAFEAAQVLDADAELMAMDKLKSLVRPHLFDGYLLHGMILETSPRSGVTYILRKGRPTIALRPDAGGNMRILCCLCMHPIGYYAGTFVGCMVPTDEVISHLILIRAKEEFFWRKANQHPASAWEAGLN